MTAVTFPEANHSFGKPTTWTDNQCYTLPVCRLLTFIPGEKDTDKAVQIPAHVSCWELSDEELQEVIKTRKVYLKVLGVNMLPASIHGIKPIYSGEGGVSDIILPPTSNQPKEPKTPADPPPPPLHRAVG